jgi:hypothetical protein
LDLERGQTRRGIFIMNKLPIQLRRAILEAVARTVEIGEGMEAGEQYEYNTKFYDKNHPGFFELRRNVDLDALLEMLTPTLEEVAAVLLAYIMEGRP